MLHIGRQWHCHGVCVAGYDAFVTVCDASSRTAVQLLDWINGMLCRSTTCCVMATHVACLFVAISIARNSTIPAPAPVTEQCECLLIGRDGVIDPVRELCSAALSSCTANTLFSVLLRYSRYHHMRHADKPSCLLWSNRQLYDQKVDKVGADPCTLPGWPVDLMTVHTGTVPLGVSAPSILMCL